MSSSNKRGLKQPLELITPPSSSTSRDKQQDQVVSLQRKRQVNTLEYRNGSYHGQIISNSERNGLGVFSWDSGEAYFGEWMQDTIHGEGVLFFPQGGFVHGFFRDAKLTGPAFFKFANGDIYEGFWKEGKLNGNCYKYFVEENKWILSTYIDGSFTRVISKGEGLPPSYVFKYITSTSDLAHRYKQAQGLNLEAVVFQDGGQFLGVISNDAPSNLGIFRYSDGKYDVGTYSKGNLHGLGRLNLHNGDVYDGYLIDGLFQGKGVFYQQETSQWVFGVFLRNKCVQIIRKGDGSFPFEITKQFRSEHHYNSGNFIDADTPFYPYQPPIYKQTPIDLEKYNFYLDLSIASSSNADPLNTSSMRKYNYFSYSNTLKASSGFSQGSSSPPRSSMRSSPSNGRYFAGNFIVKENSSSMSKTAQFSKSQGFIAIKKKSPSKPYLNNSGKQQPKSILVDSSNDKKKTKEIDTNSLQDTYELKFSDQPNTFTRFSESIPRTHFEEQSFNMKQLSEQDSKSSIPQELKVQVVPVRKISHNNTNQSPKSPRQPWSQNFIKPNIFSKQEEKKKKIIAPKMIKQSSINKYLQTDIRIKGEEQGSSFSSFQSQQILRADNFYGKKQSSARYIPINMIQEEDKLRSLSGTPLNRFKVNERAKNHFNNSSESGQNQQIDFQCDQEGSNEGKSVFRGVSREQKERNNSFLEAEKRVKRESDANTKRGDIEREKSSSEEGRIIRQQRKKSNGSQLELASLRNELANYEQMIQQEIPSRTRKSRGRRDISRDQSLSQASRTPLSTTPTLTPTHQEQQFEQKDKEEVEEELDLEDSNVVLDSIKQIKQQMLFQLNILETKQKEIVQPQQQQQNKFEIEPSLNVPDEENNQMRNDLLDQDISPDNPFEDYEHPYECGTDNRCDDNQLIVEKHTESKAGENEHKNQSYYNEEEVKIIAQKIERNLTFEKTNKKKNGSDKSSNNSSISESNRRDSAAQADLVIDETATSNNDGEVEGQGILQMKKGSQNITPQKIIKINTDEATQDQQGRGIIINNTEEIKVGNKAQESQVVQQSLGIGEYSNEDISILSGTQKDKKLEDEQNQDKQEGALKLKTTNEGGEFENQEKTFNKEEQGLEQRHDTLISQGSQQQDSNEKAALQILENNNSAPTEKQQLKREDDKEQSQKEQEGRQDYKENEGTYANSNSIPQENLNNAQISLENDKQSDEVVLQITVDQEARHKNVEERSRESRIETDIQKTQNTEAILQNQIDQERKQEEEQQKEVLYKQEKQRQDEEAEDQQKRANELKQEERKQQQEEQLRREKEEEIRQEGIRQQEFKKQQQQEEEQQRQQKVIEEEEARINELRKEQQRLLEIIDQEKQEEINQTQKNEQQKRLNEEQEIALREKEKRQEELSQKEKEVLERIEQEEQTLVLKRRDCEIEEDRLGVISLKILDEQKRYQSLHEKQLADTRTQDTQTQDGLEEGRQNDAKKGQVLADLAKGQLAQILENTLQNKDILPLVQVSQTEQVQKSFNDHSNAQDQEHPEQSISNQNQEIDDNKIVLDQNTTSTKKEENGEKQLQLTVQNQQRSVELFQGTTYSSSLPNLVPVEQNAENQNSNKQVVHQQHQSLLTNPISFIDTPLSSTAFLENKKNQLGTQKNTQQSLQSPQIEHMSTAKKDKSSQEANLNQGQDVSDTFLTEQLAGLDSSKKQFGQQFDAGSAISSIRKTSFPNLLSNSAATSAWNNIQMQNGNANNASENQSQIDAGCSKVSSNVDGKCMKNDQKNSFNTPGKMNQNSNKSEDENDGSRKHADKQQQNTSFKNELADKQEDLDLFVSFCNPATPLNNLNILQKSNNNLDVVPQNFQLGSQNNAKIPLNIPVSSKKSLAENPTSLSSNNSNSQIHSHKLETQSKQTSSNLFSNSLQVQQAQVNSQRNQVIPQDKKLETPLKQDLQIVHHIGGFQPQNRSRGGSPSQQNAAPSKIPVNFSAQNPTSPAGSANHKTVKSNLMTIVLQSPYQTEDDDNNSHIKNSIPSSPLKATPFYHPTNNAQLQNRNRFIQETYQSNPPMLQPIPGIISNQPNSSSQSYHLMAQSPQGRYVLREETRVSYMKKVTITESPRVIREVHFPQIQSQNSLQMSNLSNTSNSFIHFPQQNNNNNSFNVTNCNHENSNSLNNSFSHQTTYGIVPQQSVISVNLPVLTRPRCNSTQARIQHPQFLATPDLNINKMLSSASPRETSRILTLSPTIPHSQPTNVIQQLAPIYQTMNHSPISLGQPVPFPIHVNHPQSASPGPVRRQIIISNTTQGVLQNNIQQSRNEYYQRIIQPNNSAPSSPSSFGNPTHSSPAMIANNINNNSSMNPMIDHRKKKSNIFLDQNAIDEGQEGLCSIF